MTNIQGKGNHLKTEKRLTVIICIIMIFTLVISFVVLFKNTKQIQASTSQMVQQQTETITSDVKDLLNSYSQMCEIAASNTEVITYSEYTGSESEDQLTRESYDIQKSLTALVSEYGSDINMLGVYFPNSGEVISMARRVKKENSAYFFGSYPGLSAEKFSQMSFANRWNIHFKDNEDSHNWIVYAVRNKGVNAAYVVVDYNLDGYISRIDRSETSILIGNGTDCLFSSAIADSALYQKSQIDPQMNGNYLVRTYATRLPGISITGITSLSSINNIRVLFTLVIVVTSIIVGLSIVILLIYLRRKIFAPMDYLLETTKHGDQDTTALIHSIADDYVAFEKENTEMKQMVPQALSGQLAHLLENPSDKESLPRAGSCMALAGLQPEEGFALFGIACKEDRKGFFKNAADEINSDGRGSVLGFFLNNVLNDLLFTEYPGVLVPMRSGWFIVITACGSQADTEEISTDVQKMIEFFDHTFSTELTSTWVQAGITDKDFITAVQSITQETSYIDFWGKEHGENAEETADEIDFAQYCQMLKKLINQMNVGEYEQAVDQVDEIVNKALPADMKDVKAAKYRMYTLTALIVTSIEEQLSSEPDFVKSLEIEPRLYSAENVPQFKQAFHGILAALIAHKQEAEHLSGSGRMEEVKQYVLQHYTDNDFTASSVASHFDMTGSYLSRAFKEYTNVNILEFAQKLRVNEAKELLKTDNVKTVAQKVGFWDTQGLVRAFKKYEGVSPSDYKNHQNLEK